ncbi:MAG TPA: hypothetical protein VE287_06530, partial [Actinopolymorphaceae bacterium]|nr:hypothetical protein [Actinopolymorphaceae bacterium]
MPGRTKIPAALSARPFLVEEARRHGLTLRVLRGRRFRSVFRGVYVAADRPDTLELRVDAARLVLPARAVFSHTTAARLVGLPVPDRDDCPLHATVPPGTARPAVRGIIVHEGLVSSPIRQPRGRLITGPARTFLDLAPTLSLVDLVILGDAMVRGKLVTAAALRTAAASTRRRGARQARRAAELVLPGVDSPPETIVRLLIVFAGLPCPLPNEPVHDEFGQWVATVDLQYREQRIAIEYDSDLHRSIRRKWRHDVRTRDELRRLGWDVITVTYDDLCIRPLQT